VTWTDYWDGETTIYANARHKRVHYEGIARDIVSLLTEPNARVVDYGCGEALSAHLVADACARLFLCESSPNVRERLAARYAARPDIEVISVREFEHLPPGMVDIIVANSVVQYLSDADLTHFLAVARERLSASGRLVLADIIPRRIGPLRDAAELLRFAAANGFLVAAGAGLVRSFFSDYRQIRQRLGLLRFDEAEMIGRLRAAGFDPRRRYPNVGHNSKRMTFVATIAEAGDEPAGQS
jgi:hypothetical protein